MQTNLLSSDISLEICQNLNNYKYRLNKSDIFCSISIIQQKHAMSAELIKI